MMRVKELWARNFRSLSDVRLTDLPSVVLLYGENNTGKSNVLRAAGAWLRLVSWLWGADQEPASDVRAHRSDQEHVLDLTDPEDEARASMLIGAPVAAQFRRDTRGKRMAEMHLGGRLALSAEPGLIELTLEVRVSLKGAHTLAFQVQRSEMSVGGSPPIVLHEPIAPSDPVAAAIRRGLAGRWQRISADRRFHEELLPVGVTEDEAIVSPDGQGLLWALFRAYTGTDRVSLERFERFSRMIATGPVPLGAPRPVLLEGSSLGLQIGHELITEVGSGARQWALLAGMLAMSDAPIARLEEPEANLSFRAQKQIMERLGEWVADDGQRPHQIFVTSHSPLTYDLTSNAEWYEVWKEEGVTRAKRHEDARGLAVLFPEQPVLPPGSMVLQPGNLMWLPPEFARHLGVETGDLLQAILGDNGEIRLMGDDRFSELAAPGGMNDGEDES